MHDSKPDALALQQLLAEAHDPLEFLKGLFLHAPMGLAVYSPDGYCITANQAFLDLFGSIPPAAYCVLDDPLAAQANALDEIRKAFRGEVGRLPVMWYDPGKLPDIDVPSKRVAISATFFPLFNSAGEVEFVAATYDDVTDATTTHEALAKEQEELTASIAERDHMQAALKNQYLLLQSVIESSSSPIYSVDMGMRVTGFNSAYVKVMRESYGIEISLGVRRDTCAPEHPTTKIVVASLRGALIGKATLERLTTNVPGEPTKHFDVAYRPVISSSGEIVGASAFSTDVTEIVNSAIEIASLNSNLERRVAERTAELESANREMEAFSYSVSHDLRAPLRAINGFAQILEEELAASLNQEHARHLTRLRVAANTMGHLIEDMLTLSRITRIQRREITFRPDTLVREVIESLESEVSQRSIAFAVQDMEPCTTDRRLMRQVFANLLSNSIKFTRNNPESKIRVYCIIGNSERVWVVEDNGIGFDPVHSEKISDRLNGYIARAPTRERALDWPSYSESCSACVAECGLSRKKAVAHVSILRLPKE